MTISCTTFRTLRKIRLSAKGACRLYRPVRWWCAVRLLYEPAPHGAGFRRHVRTRFFLALPSLS